MDRTRLRRCQPIQLRPVEIHLRASAVAARWIMAVVKGGNFGANGGL